jgi:ribose 5-phosphate isomerase B
VWHRHRHEAANKVPGVRAALLYSETAAEYARRHNDANVLVFGGRTMTFEQVRSYLETFFRYEFEGGRYAERNAYMTGMDGAKGCR